MGSVATPRGSKISRGGIGGASTVRGHFGVKPASGGSAAAPTAKPTPSTPAPGPAPWDTQYESTLAALNKRRDSSLTNLAANRTAMQKAYGYNLDGSENTADPYSRLSTLRADYEKIKRGSSVGYAARGQLYTGAYQNQVNSNQEAQNRALDSLRKDWQSQVNSLNEQESDIYGSYNSALTDAMNTRIDRAASNVADGTAPVATAKTRRESVLEALSTPKKWKPGHLQNLINEARKNGWIK